MHRVQEGHGRHVGQEPNEGGEGGEEESIVDEHRLAIEEELKEALEEEYEQKEAGEERQRAQLSSSSLRSGQNRVQSSTSIESIKRVGAILIVIVCFVAMLTVCSMRVRIMKFLKGDARKV